MDKIAVKVVCFAGLRKYFGSEITIQIEPGVAYSEVISELIELNPEAKEVLISSRVAVNEKFIPLDEKLGSGDTLFLIPPSSGG